MTILLIRRAQLLAGIILAVIVYGCIIHRAYLTFLDTNSSQDAPATTTTRVPQGQSKLASNNSSMYDCAISWLRIPKTASTTVAHAFIGPLLANRRSTGSGQSLFPNVENDPKTCIESVGGCARHWKGWKQTKALSKAAGIGNAVPAPPYGFPLHQNETIHLPLNNQRCFPQRGGRKIRCFEYDSSASALIFGPDRFDPTKRKKHRNKRNEKDSHLSTSKRIGYYASSPAPQTHVALDPSLFGWILPEKPMVFSTFREPLDRLMSSFHFGIKFGAGRPGEVEKCSLLGAGGLQTEDLEWQRQVMEARKIATLRNDTTVYQRMLREYLTACSNAADNVYVQFLDPVTRDVDVALARLERYVIVGLQSDMDETLQRWRSITLQTCALHPKFRLLEKVIANASTATDNGKIFRKSITEAEGMPYGRDASDDAEYSESTETIQLASLDIESFELDLQLLIRNMISGDEVIYKRVLEMYHGPQKHLAVIK